MTAIVCVSQPDQGLIHVATDAAMYNQDGKVCGFGNKVTTIPHWPGVITGLGNGAISILFAQSLSEKFSSFDDFIERSEQHLPTMMKSWGIEIPFEAHIIVAGISEQNGPEAYAFRTGDCIPATGTAADVEASDCYDAPFKLVKLPNVVMSPTADDQVHAAGYDGIDPTDRPSAVVWAMRKVLEMQRHTTLPDDIGGIGGWGQLITISKYAIRQRIIARWPDDQVGGALRPPAVDWEAWHRENPRPS